MGRIGLLSLQVPGHVHPSLALAAELQARGHRVFYLNVPGVQAACRRAGVELVAYGQRWFSPEAAGAATPLSARPGFAFRMERMDLLTLAALEEVPGILEQLGVDLLIVDQLFPAGATLAEHAGLPFVSLASALIVNREDGVPPPTVAWPYDPSPAGVARNGAGWQAFSHQFAPLLDLLNGRRERWGLKPYSDYLQDSFSPLLQIAQQPPTLEFPRRELPAEMHLVGPLRRRAAVGESQPFPWQELDATRPLVYASLGTLQNSLEWIFQVMLEALGKSEFQAVVSLGGSSLMLDRAPRNVLVVPYAPQKQLLQRAALCITHAGLNTSTDCLQAGVPMVAIPIASEQPGIAARLVWLGVAIMVPLQELTAERLREAILEIYGQSSYGERAREQARAIAALPEPVSDAARLVEGVLAGL
jgi:zeaxanthin glucosyltransferase